MNEKIDLFNSKIMRIVVLNDEILIILIPPNSLIQKIISLKYNEKLLFDLVKHHKLKLKEAIFEAI